MALRRSARLMGLDPSPPTASEHTYTTTGGVGPNAPAKAAHRFWDTPELVHHLLTFLNTDRIDLLATSRVSKLLRVQSLKVWVRRLDIPVAVASDRLKFFKANPSLLKDVRYLRLRTSRDYFLNCTPRFTHESIRHWHDLNQLLAMLSQCPLHGLPVIDLTILPFDLLRLPTVLKQRVVALRIFNSRVYGSVTDEHNGSLEHYSGESLEATEDKTWDLDWAPSESVRQNHTVAKGCWDRIIDILKRAVQGPGLHAFEIEALSASMAPLASETIEELLYHVGRHASTLLDLRIDLEELSISDFLLSAPRFDQLETLVLQYHHKDRLSMIETFLDGLTNLRQLYLSVALEPLLSLRQTFPHLRLIDINFVKIGPNERRDFEKRHGKVVIAGGESLLAGNHARSYPYALDLIGYPNLGYIEIGRPEDVQHHLDYGHTPYDVCFGSRMRAEAIEHSLTILRSSPEASHRLTCLQIFSEVEESLNSLSTALASSCFPNLTELHLKGIRKYARRRLVQFVASLTSAHALRVICLWNIDVDLDDPDIFRNEVLPSSLEYVVCQTFGQEPKTYRVVSDHPEGLVVRTPEGGKRGFLQRVPNAIRTPISRAGVWNRPIQTSTPRTVLDHIGIPTLLLP